VPAPLAQGGAWGGFLAGLLKGGEAMTINIPFTPYELLQLVLTALLVYVTWKSINSGKRK